MLKYAGIPLIVLGALALVFSYFKDLVDNNVVQIAGLGLIIVGLVVHIVLQKVLRN